jgi:hypothetical protein
MTEVLELSKYHMYAEDLQIYHSRPRKVLFECIRDVNNDLSKVFEWSLANSLKLNSQNNGAANIQKSLIGSNLGDDFISYEFKAKNLGLRRYF